MLQGRFSTYTLQSLTCPLLRSSVAGSLPVSMCFRMISSIDCLRILESNRALVFPLIVTGMRFLDLKIVSSRRLYVSMHSSTSISRRPSMIAMRLDIFSNHSSHPVDMQLPSSARASNQVKHLVWLHSWLPSSFPQLVDPCHQSLEDIKSGKPADAVTICKKPCQSWNRCGHRI